MRNKINEVTATSKNIWANAQEFVHANCLVIVSGFSGYAALHNLDSNWYKGLLFASFVIALEAAVLYVKHFNKPLTK